MRSRLLVFVLALVVPVLSRAQSVYYVATNGNDTTGNGSLASPWATIERAVDMVPDGALVLVRPGTYNGRVRLDGGSPGRVFAQGIVIRSEVAYQARLRDTGTVVICYYGKGITLEGFDIAHSTPTTGGLVIQIQDLRGPPGGSDAVSRITIRNNVIHDSRDNDLLKINYGASDVTVEGNLFYNQSGSDEHIDLNSTRGVVVQDNVFFNDFAASGRTNGNDTSGFIVIKDSDGAADGGYAGSQEITVRRNVFLGWEGSTGSNFVLVGEDGQDFYEARDVLIENNLMLGNAPNTMRAPFGVKGGRDITFRHNTVVGDFPSLAFAFRLNVEGANPNNLNIRFFGNVWSDPTGTMEDFSDTPIGETDSFTLSRNLYWNGGSPIPQNPGADLINHTDDATGIVADPLLADPAGAVRPSWNAATSSFADGSRTIREVFERLVSLYAVPGAGSPVLEAALAGEAPVTDILGTPRGLGGTLPNLGAYQASAGHALRFFGHAPNNIAQDIDRVRIRIDDPATTLSGPPADVGAQDFTIELWVKGLLAENPQPAIGCGANEAWITGNIVIDRDRYNQPRKFGLSFGDGALAFGVTSASGARTICGSTSVLDGSWHHLAVQRRRSDGRMWLYVDGALEAEADGPDGDVSYPDDGVPGNFCPPASASCANSDPFLVIGTEKHTLGPGFSGTVDEVRLSSSLRYLAPFTRPAAAFRADASTAALYHFDEGAGDVVSDRAGALGGGSPGQRRFGGSAPAGPVWVVSDAPLASGGGQGVTIGFDAAVSDIGEGSTTATATVVLVTSDGEVTEAPVSVQYTTAELQAAAGSDYVSASGTLIFPAGTGSGESDQVEVTILSDLVDEEDEAFRIDLQSASGATISGASHTVTIVDNDMPPELSISDLTVTEGDSGTSGAVVLVTLTPPSGQTVSVSYATMAGTATAPSDFANRSGTLTFAPGVIEQTVTVPIVGDRNREADEELAVLLTNPQNATLADHTGAVTVLDNDVPGTFEFSAASVTVRESAARAVVTVRRTGGTAGNATVGYRTLDGTATGGADYTTTSGTLVFGLGVLSRTFSVPLLRDTAIEGDEVVLLALHSPGSGGVLGPLSAAALTIVDDDRPGAFRFQAATVSRSEAFPGAAITVTRTGGLAGAVSVQYATANGTAAAGLDYAATSGVLSFAAGQASRTFTVPLIGDAIDETNETVILSLSSPAGGATLGSPAVAELRILDQDSGGVVQLSTPLSVGESDGNLTFTARRTGGSAGGVTVDYATEADSAQLGADFVGASGTISFAAGELSKTIVVTILEDALVEGPEMFRLVLTNPTGGATLGVNRAAAATIVDDEAAGTFQWSAGRYGVREGLTLRVTVTRAGPASAQASVDYTAIAGTAGLGLDFAAASGTLVFRPNIRSQSFLLRATPDAAIEGDEMFTIALSNPQGGASLGTQAVANVAIADDDAAGTLRFSSASVNQGEDFGTATLTVVRTGGLGEGVTVDYATTGGTATNGLDYTATTGQLSFAAGQPSRTFTVPLLMDSLDEPNETVSLALSNPGGGASLGAPFITTLTLLDNDLGPGHLRFAAAALARSEKQTRVVVSVRRTARSTGAISVAYAASGGTATAGADYLPASGTLDFASGQTSRTFILTLVNDTLDEPSETVELTLSSPTGGATLEGPNVATVTINDDDAGGQVQFAAVATAGAEGAPATVTVTRKGGSASGVSVNYATGGGTATAGADYTSRGRNLGVRPEPDLEDLHGNSPLRRPHRRHGDDRSQLVGTERRCCSRIARSSDALRRRRRPLTDPSRRHPDFGEASSIPHGSRGCARKKFAS